jgi:hypothetical protein
MHPMTAKKKLIRAATLLLFGAGLGAGLLMLLGVPLRLPVSARPCRECTSPTATPERESDTGHERPDAPRPGDWRYRFHEPGQDFDDYRSTLVNWKCAHRTTFYIQPIGEAEPATAK